MKEKAFCVSGRFGDRSQSQWCQLRGCVMVLEIALSLSGANTILVSGTDGRWCALHGAGLDDGVQVLLPYALATVV
jgi:hypothetical protein